VSSPISIFTAPPPRPRRKRINPHRLLGIIILWLFAADDMIRVLNWLVRSLISEIFH
jgi:hypothetical protein